MTSEAGSSKPKPECQSCRVVKLFEAEVAECVEKLDCHWAIISGYGHFCKHPSSLMYFDSGLSRLFN